MTYSPNTTSYTDTIKVLTDKTNADMTGVKAELDGQNAAVTDLANTVAAHTSSNSPHNATATATASRLMIRDTNGRCQVANPSAAGDIANKAYVDSIQTNLTTHANLGTAHGSTSAATASAIMQRDSGGRAKVAAPVASDDIARKQEVDTVQTSLNNHTNSGQAHGSTSAATASAIMQRDTAGRAKVAAPLASDDIARKLEVDTVQTNLTTHINDSAAHGASVTATSNSFVRRDGAGRTQVAAPLLDAEATNKLYVDTALAGKAPTGFGLGTLATTASTNWNNYTTTGFYQGTGLTNQPSGTVSSIWMVMVIGQTTTVCQQLAFSKDNTQMFSRGYDGAAWTAWKQIARTGDNIGNLVITGTLDLSQGNGRLVIPVGTDKYAT